MANKQKRKPTIGTGTRKINKPGDKERLLLRRHRVLKYRLAGKSYRDISRMVGISESTVSADIQAILEPVEESARKNVELYIKLELERLDKMARPVWFSATRGDTAAVDQILKIMQRRAKLLGLDAPTKREVSGPEGGPLEFMDSIERDRRILKLEAKLGAVDEDQ